MTNKPFGNPVTVQEHRETISATIDVRSGMTDIIIKRTLVDAETGAIVSSQTIRDSAPTQDRLRELEAAVEAAAQRNIEKVDLDGVE